MAEQVVQEGAGPQQQGELGEHGEQAKGATRRRQAEHLTEEALELWHKVADKSRKPPVGAAIAGAAVLAAGAVWGATEAAVAAVAAYAVFRMLRRRGRGEVGGERRPDEERERHAASAS